MYCADIETMARDELEQLQIERLQATLNRVYRNVAFYKDAFDRAKVTIDAVRSVDDLRRLPLTTKDDLREAYPYDMFALPLRDIVRIHATSGTTGRPIVTGYTRNDVHTWAELMARQLCAVGITDHDVVQVAFSYGLFTGGLGFHYGAEHIGASVIPSSPGGGNVLARDVIMKDYKATALVTTPSYAVTMANLLPHAGIHPEELSLRCGMFGGEPWSESLRELLERKLRIDAYDAYGVAELMGPGVAAECTEKDGLHINEDHFIVEVIDPRSLDPVPPGQTGELVFTTVTKEGFPLIRYRTGDLAGLLESPCRCGRTLRRMSRVSGRTDDKFFFHGTHLLPSQIHEVLLQAEGIQPDYRIVLTREDGVDAMEVKVAISEGIAGFDEVGTLVKMKDDIAQRLHERLGVQARVSFVEASSIRAPDGGKRSPVLDLRER